MPGGIVHDMGVAARCMRLRGTLQAYLDGEADPARAEAMAAHLEECRRCGLESEAYTSLKVALAARAPLSQVDPAALERLEAFAASLARAPEDAEAPQERDPQDGSGEGPSTLR